MSNNIELEEITNFDEAFYKVKDHTAEPSIEDETIVCDIFIKTLNMPALTDWDDLEKPFLSELYIVPRLEHISQEIKDKVFDSMGFEESLEKYGSEFAQLEFINYGLGIRLAGGMDSYATEKEAIDAMKEHVAGISTLIGFYMDKTWNKIGTTGWDTLQELVSNVDQFKASMERITQ
jgi:hypothetical protein